MCSNTAAEYQENTYQERNTQDGYKSPSNYDVLDHYAVHLVLLTQPHAPSLTSMISSATKPWASPGRCLDLKLRGGGDGPDLPSPCNCTSQETSSSSVAPFPFFRTVREH